MNSDFQAMYHPGAKNTTADGLCHLPIPCHEGATEKDKEIAITQISATTQGVITISEWATDMGETRYFRT